MKKRMLFALVGMLNVGLISAKERVFNNHKAVDLGIEVNGKKVYFAKDNLSLTKDASWGDYFSWGDIKPYYKSYKANPNKETSLLFQWDVKNGYHWWNYKWSVNGSKDKFSKYNTVSYYGKEDGIKVLEEGDDVATISWGKGWRIPTQEEWEALQEQCDWEWSAENGVVGYRVSGKGGSSIFLPAAGFVDNTQSKEIGECGSYWSSSLDSDYSRSAYFLYFISDFIDAQDGSFRYYGRSIRPVYSN